MLSHTESDCAAGIAAAGELMEADLNFIGGELKK